MTAGELLGARRLAELLRRHGVRPRKELGQNFVIDPNTIRKIMAIAAIREGDRVLEIGAGAGSLTVALAQAATSVTAVELDSRLTPVLEDVLVGVANVDVVEADATRMDLASIHASRLVGNLPYGIAATVIIKALEEAGQVRDLTVMTQREVGQRLVAEPGSKAYGYTSVVVRYFADARVAGGVSRRAFYPIPGVDSVIVKMTRRSTVPEVDRRRLFRVVRVAFSQRRKTLRGALAAEAGSPGAAEAAARAAGIDPGARAEDIDLDGFIALARRFE